MNSDVQARSKRLVVRVVLIQAAGTLALALSLRILEGPRAALAALAGGSIVAFGSALFGWRMFRPGVAGAQTLATAMYTAVALKWVWYGFALYASFAWLKLAAAQVLAGMVVALAANWLALGPRR